MRRLLTTPELAALAGAVLVWGFFAVVAGAPFRSVEGTAAWLNAAAPLGILAVAVALLMIGGEFDLSVGSVIGVSGMALMLLTTQAGWAITPAIVVTLLLGAAIGLANGLLVTHTRVPSFLVTLGTLFVLRGLTIGATRALTGRTQLGGLSQAPGYESWSWLLASDLGRFRIGILWWVIIAAAATWLLRRTRPGNWIYAVGGGADAARNSGVPVTRVKVCLFIGTAIAATLVGIMQAVRFTGADALRGEGQEFRAIIAVVIGGTLLTGGYGSAAGAVLGAMIFGIVQQGIVISGIDADWFQVFLGAMLVGAMIANDWVRRRTLAVARTRS